jgi:radical SAM superfamily enzyme YgiQ (UPF0313 family)
MNALLIYPEFPDTYWSFKHTLKFLGKRAAQPPLGLMTVAALLPKAWKKRLVDTNVERLRDRDLAWADVALISAMHIQHPSLAAIVERCRAHGLRTVVGGPIASSISAAELKVDHVVIGEAESLIAGLARELEQGTASLVYKADQKPAMESSPLPDLSLIRMNRYSTMAVQASRQGVMRGARCMAQPIQNQLRLHYRSLAQPGRRLGVDAADEGRGIHFRLSGHRDPR